MEKSMGKQHEKPRAEISSIQQYDVRRSSFVLKLPGFYGVKTDQEKTNQGSLGLNMLPRLTTPQPQSQIHQHRCPQMAPFIFTVHIRHHCIAQCCYIFMNFYDASRLGDMST